MSRLLSYQYGLKIIMWLIYLWKWWDLIFFSGKKQVYKNTMRILEVKCTIINNESKRTNLTGWTQLKSSLKNGRIGHWKAHKLKREKMLENPEKNVRCLHSIVKSSTLLVTGFPEAEERKHEGEATSENAPY